MMGRQAYITRLALGRSPYEAPVRSESGEFILGPYAHEFDNTDGYTQQYNERGHPEFRASRAAARELRRAKNDVLSTVGVVYKEAEPTHSKKNNGELVNMVLSENQAGFLLFSIDNLLMFCSLWWLISLRMRVEAFESYSVPLFQIIRSELRVFGMSSFLFAGLPACLVSAILSTWRTYWIGERVKQWLADFLSPQIFNLGFFFLYSSIEAFGTMQSLHLIPASQTMTWGSLVPFSRQSPIQLPNTLFGALSSPILLLWVYTSLDQHLQSTLWYVIRSITSKPDNPDRISRLALERTQDAVVKVPGLREPPWTLSNEFRFQSFRVENWFRDLLSPFFELRGAGEDTPSQLPTEFAAAPPARLEEPDLDRASTATPDPADLFAIDEIEQQPQPAQPEHHPLSRANTLFSPLNQSPTTTPPASPRVRASLIHRDSETVTMQLELLETQREMDEELNSQGLEALERLANGEEVAEHPSSEAEAAADGETMASELARAIRERDEEDRSEQQQEQIQQQDKPPQHRVTALSNFSCDAFASHAACVITTAALIPLETLFVRSLALAFLGSSSLASDVRPLFSWRGWRYNGTLLGIVGLQALVSSAVWGLGTGVAIGLGRLKYRWGRL